MFEPFLHEAFLFFLYFCVLMIKLEKLFQDLKLNSADIFPTHWSQIDFVFRHMQKI